jgi:hypothetical protein
MSVDGTSSVRFTVVFCVLWVRFPTWIRQVQQTTTTNKLPTNPPTHPETPAATARPAGSCRHRHRRGQQPEFWWREQGQEPSAEHELNRWIDKARRRRAQAPHNTACGRHRSGPGRVRVGSGPRGAGHRRGKVREPASVRPASTHGTAVPPAFGSFFLPTKRRPRSGAPFERKEGSERARPAHAHMPTQAGTLVSTPIRLRQQLASVRPPRHPRPTVHALEAVSDSFVLDDELRRRVSRDDCCCSLLSSRPIRSDSFSDPFMVASECQYNNNLLLLAAGAWRCTRQGKGAGRDTHIASVISFPLCPPPTLPPPPLLGLCRLSEPATAGPLKKNGRAACPRTPKHEGGCCGDGTGKTTTSGRRGDRVGIRKRQDGQHDARTGWGGCEEGAFHRQTTEAIWEEWLSGIERRVTP